jgi:hypothetical protein
MMSLPGHFYKKNLPFNLLNYKLLFKLLIKLIIQMDTDLVHTPS